MLLSLNCLFISVFQYLVTRQNFRRPEFSTSHALEALFRNLFPILPLFQLSASFTFDEVLLMCLNHLCHGNLRVIDTYVCTMIEHTHLSTKNNHCVTETFVNITEIWRLSYQHQIPPWTLIPRIHHSNGLHFPSPTAAITFMFAFTWLMIAHTWGWIHEKFLRANLFLSAIFFLFTN